MSLHTSFAANLARLCKQQPSIQAVCRSTEINRQQFHRYLAGDAIPRGRNLEKICRFFGVEEGTLFLDPPDGRAALLDDTGESLPWYGEGMNMVLDAARYGGAASVPAGIYFTYFVYSADPPGIVRSTTIVDQDGDVTRFRRITGVTEKKGSWWSHFVGDHQGIVLQRQYAIYFVAIDTKAARAPTMLVVNWIPNAHPMMGGHACILTPAGPSVTGVVMTRAPRGTSVRKALRMSHAFGPDDPSLDPLVVDALEAQCRTIQTMVTPLDLSVKPLRRRS